jgi:hypothetical protein
MYENLFYFIAGLFDATAVQDQRNLTEMCSYQHVFTTR